MEKINWGSRQQDIPFKGRKLTEKEEDLFENWKLDTLSEFTGEVYQLGKKGEEDYAIDSDYDRDGDPTEQHLFSEYLEDFNKEFKKNT